MGDVTGHAGRTRTTAQLTVRRIGTAAAILLFIWLLSELDWSEALSGVRGLRLLAIAGVEICFLGGQLLNAIRWWVLLRAQGIQVGIFSLFKLVMAGAFASNFLPSTVGGDIVRIAGVNRYTHNEGLSLGSVVVDRLLNILTTILLFPLVLITFGGRLLDLFRAAETATGVLAAVGTFWMRIWEKLAENFRQAVDASRRWLRSPVVLLEAMAVSSASTFIVYVGVWLLAREIGIPISFLEVMAISVTTYLITLLPISINGYGLREVAVTVLYVELGATLEQASLLAIILRLLRLLETLPGALWISAFLTTSENTQPPEE